ncbi:hypothetical protein AAF712_016304 [Marasmius tenuissimus]|uniref:T6SS Phospholipase effector Tle1-like catalytic domain-containing protein n=1 Tax=Marasmius tenuissimus TaxID=585030 RepID=A0ABR2Z691_9AGAR
MDHVCFFRHALALDEWRVKFVAEYAGGPNGSFADPRDAQNGSPPPKKEVWFAGTHSDIGGGSIENKELTSNGPALRWMIKESIEAGLVLTPFSGEWEKVYGKLKSIKRGFLSPWWLLEILPERAEHNSPWYRSLVPHRGRLRPILHGQNIHQSVYPSNFEYVNRRLPEDLRKPVGEHVERDEFDDIALDIHQCVEGTGRWKSLSDWASRETELLSLAQSKNGLLAFQDLYESLKKTPISHRECDATIAKMRILCAVARHFPKGHSHNLPYVVKGLLRHKDSSKEDSARDFVNKFSHAAEAFKIFLDAPVKSLALSKKISANGRAAERKSYLLAVASAQSPIPVYDLDARHIIRSLRGHTHDVESLSFSPDSNLGTLILVSGSADGTIRSWNVDRGTQWRFPNEGLIDGALSVSFCSDGKRIISGGRDGSPRVWEVNRDDCTLDLLASPTAKEKHRGHILSVAAATAGPTDDLRLVSVSKERKHQQIRLWKCSDGALSISPTLELASRKPNDPKEVVFLTKDDYLTVSSKGIFSITNAVTGSLEECNPDELKLQGVAVRSLGFCHPDQLACGLSDGRIIVWSVGQWNRDPLEALTKQERWKFRMLRTFDYHLQGKAPSPVTSIAYSDDQNFLVAGYADGHVVVWYAQGTKGVVDNLLSHNCQEDGPDQERHERVLYTHHDASIAGDQSLVQPTMSAI